MATIDELNAQVAQLRAEVEQLRGQIANAGVNALAAAPPAITCSNIAVKR